MLSQACKILHCRKAKQRQKRVDSLPEADRSTVIGFLERDDNSRIMSGKRDTITRNKMKKQKRLLLETMRNLFGKFRYEYPSVKIGYTLFCRLRPFWVLQPTFKDRETCLCKRHDNIQLMADALYREKAASSVNPTELLKFLVCKESKDCMYRECTVCSDKCLPRMSNIDGAKDISFLSWVTQKLPTESNDGENKQSGHSQGAKILHTLGPIRKI